MAEDGQVYKIGEVADLLNISIRAIRFYEDEGLVSPQRSGKGTRLYTQRHVDRLQAIRRMTENGFSLDFVRVLTDLRKRHTTGDQSQDAVCLQLDGVLADIRARMDQLQDLADQIAAGKMELRKCAGCQNVPTNRGCPDCPVRQQLSNIEILNLIWDQDAD